MKSTIFTPAKIEEIKKLVREGKNKDEISSLIGCSTNTLVTRASQLKISLRRGVQTDQPQANLVHVLPKKPKPELPACRSHTTGPVRDEEIEYARSLLERFPDLRWVALARLLGRTHPEAIRKRLDPEFAAIRKAEELRRYEERKKERPAHVKEATQAFLKFQGNKGKSREVQPTSALKPSSAEEKYNKKLANVSDRMLKALAAEAGAETSTEAQSFAELMEEAKQRDPPRKSPSDEPRLGRKSETTHKELMKPIYDPRRDGKVYHTTATAEHFGDPLPGQSALDKMKAAGRSVDDTINRYRKTW